MEEVALAALCPARVRRSIRPHPAARVRAPRISAPRAAGHVRVAAKENRRDHVCPFASSSEESQRHSSLTCLRISGFETNHASRVPDFLRDLKQLSEEKGRRGRQPFHWSESGSPVADLTLQPRLGRASGSHGKGVLSWAPCVPSHVRESTMSSKRKQKAAAQMQMQQQATAEPEEPVYQAVRARTHDAASRACARARARVAVSHARPRVAAGPQHEDHGADAVRGQVGRLEVHHHLARLSLAMISSSARVTGARFVATSRRTRAQAQLPQLEQNDLPGTTNREGRVVHRPDRRRDVRGVPGPQAAPRDRAVQMLPSRLHVFRAHQGGRGCRARPPWEGGGGG